MRVDKRLINRIVGFGLLASMALMMFGAAATGGGQVTASIPTDPLQSTASASKSVVLRVYFDSIAQRDALAAEFGAEEIPTTGGYLTMWVNQDIYRELQSRGLRIEIDQKSTDEVNSVRWGSNGDTFYGGYLTVEEMIAFLDQMVLTYPTLAEKVDIGDTWCKSHAPCPNPAPGFNGYDLFVLHITNQAIAGPKPVYWYDTGIHSREIATPEMSMRLIRWLLDGYASNPDAHWLVDYHDIWIMPMLNLDGHHIVEAGGGGASPYYQRKNGNIGNGCTTWPPSSGNHSGTDLNRNFPFLWNCCGGSSGQACGETYRGPSAGSDPETQAVMAKISSLIPDQRGPNNSDAAPITTTGVVQSMHSNAALNLYPWGWTGSPSPNNADLAQIGKHMQATNAGGNGYQACQPPNCLYSVDGDSFDWSYGDLGAASFTTEVGGSGFFPQYSTIDAMFNLNRGALVYQTKIARTPYLTAKGPDANTVATNPMTVTQGTPSELTATINHNWTGNTYNQNIAAAEYYIDTPPWAGGTPVAMNGTFTSNQVPVQATIDTTGITPGRHIIFVRGRGINDYGGYQSWGPVSAAWLDVLQGGPTPTPCATCTNTPTATNTSVPPTATPTNTSVPPTATGTNTPEPPTATNTPEPPTATNTPGGATPTPCGLSFSDVNPSDYFYVPVMYLACNGVISGYSDGTFRPYNNTTRGQLTKIVVLAEGWTLDCPTEPTFSDVPTTHTFYCYVETAVEHSIISGYSDGTFRPENNVTRGQLSKIVVLAEGWTEDCPEPGHFSDVPPTDPFFCYIETAYNHTIISGYADGTFRPGNPATRGQISKIVYEAVTGP
jgi:hypothetical protein